MGDTSDALGLDDWRARVARELGIEPDAVDEALRHGAAEVPIDALHVAGPCMPASVPTRQGPWEIRQQFDDPRMDVAASQIKEGLEGGVEALWLVVGLDHGIRVLTPGDLDLVLAHVDIARTPTYLEPEGDVLSLAMGWVAVAGARGVPVDELRGGFGADPLGTLARSGTLVSGMRGARRELIELASFSRERAPGVRSILVSTSAYHDAGATSVQEIAWGLASGIQYLTWLVNEGVPLEEAVEELQFAVSVSSQLFGEIAKLRALRWVWAKALAAAGVPVASRRMALHVRSASNARTRRDVWVNSLRGTAETFAAAVGGADSIACGLYDFALGPADARAHRLARNTQHVLRAEAHLDRVTDPAGGSWTVEALTRAYAEQAWELFRDIQRRGGMARALRRGRISSALDARRRVRSARIARREEPVLGVSRFPLLEEPQPKRSPVNMEDVEVELGNPFGEANPDQRHEALLAFAQTLRDPGAPLGAVADSALAASRLGVDVFSLGTLLRTGRASVYLEPMLSFHPAAEWEALRDSSERWFRARGRRPAGFLAAVGPAAGRRASTSWTRNLLAAVGISSDTDSEATDIESNVAALAAREHVDVAVICGAADAVREAAVELAPRLKAKGATLVLLACDPGDDATTFRKKGVDSFLYEGGDVLEALRRVLRVLGVAS